MKIDNLFKTLFLSSVFFILANSQAYGAATDSIKLPDVKLKAQKKPPKVEEDFSADGKYDKSLVRMKEYLLDDVDGDTGYIDLGNLAIGQSGIIVNKKHYPIILAVASVIESNDKRSKLEFSPYTNLQQDAMPNTNLKVSSGDIFVLNYLYEASMVIAPNVDSFQAVRFEFKDFSFLHPDLFAAFLKVGESPIPTKELILQYAQEQNLGSLVIVIENKAYLIDTRTFKIVKTIDIKYDNDKTIKPFYTRVDEIETGTFDFGAESIGEYTKYYKELLDIK